MYSFFQYPPNLSALSPILLDFFHYCLLFASTKENLKGKTLYCCQVVNLMTAFFKKYIKRTPLPEVPAEEFVLILIKCRKESDQSFSLARMKSRFRRAMLLIETFLGHSASQARVFVQLPKPSSSILANIALARRNASGLP